MKVAERTAELRRRYSDLQEREGRSGGWSTPTSSASRILKARSSRPTMSFGTQPRRSLLGSDAVDGDDAPRMARREPTGGGPDQGDRELRTFRKGVLPERR